MIVSSKEEKNKGLEETQNLKSFERSFNSNHGRWIVKSKRNSKRLLEEQARGHTG